MFHLRKTKRLIFTAAAVTTLCLVLSSFLPIVHSEENSSFTVPCTIATYGNAWNGALAFDLSGNFDALVVMDTNGSMIDYRMSNTTYESAYNIAPSMLLFMGEPQVDGALTAPTFATHIWNMTSNMTQDFPNVISHHDVQYDPVNHTFLTLQEYVRQIGNNSFLFDKIVQVDTSGNVLWSWDTYDHIPLNEVDPFNATTTLNGQTVEEFAHANSIDWHYNEGIIFLNLRHTNTFYKISQATGNVIWACGQFGNFTLLDSQGNNVKSLWYHSHDTKEVFSDVFTMFDNDYNNVTNPNDCHSRLIEVILNEKTMTAHVNWSWEAPKQYWTPYGGATLILPNGDYLGDFGTPSHRYPQTQPWNFNDKGAVFVEVNKSGQIVRTFTFPTGWFVYHVDAVTKTFSQQKPTLFSSIVVIAIISIVSIGILISFFFYRKKLRNDDLTTT